jgi:Xaa-Pro aminopeptidase
MNARVDRLRERLEEPLLVTTGVNVVYLSGFESSNAALLVEPERVRLFTDFRYREAAGQVEGVEYTELPRNLYAGLAGELSGRVGFEAGGVTYAEYAALAQSPAELVPRSGLVEELRAVKEPEELDSIRRAAAVADEAYARLADEPFVGRTETEVAWRMFQLLKEAGADWVAFPSIVATGPNGALPHAHPGDRVVQAGELIVVDAGARVNLVVSDCTRTFAAGAVSPQLREIHEVCLRAQLAGLASVRAGVTGSDADAAAREVIDEAGYGEHFGHGLGHGVGMDVHEAPGLRPESEDVLAAGNVVTVEPGIYLPGVGGVRIEDLVVVTEDEPEVLSKVTKELVEVG